MKKFFCAVLLLCIAAGCAAAPPPSVQPSEPPGDEAPPSPEPSPEPPQAVYEIVDLGGVELNVDIHTDQLGYRPGDAKRAVLPEKDGAFSVVRLSDGAAVYIGAAGDAADSPASAETVRTADFSDLAEPGEYCVVTDSGRSYPFTIGEGVYSELRKALLDFYEYQKCGVDLECGLWSHAACHTEAAAVLDSDGNETGEFKDVSGGWHDAGDYGRYIVPAAQTVAQLLLGYELSPNPDGGVLDAVWFEMEWMLKMQDETTGGVYHKVSCKSFNALDQMPDKERGALVLSPVSAAATADFAAAAAMAARFYPDQRERLLNAARVAWEWCEANPNAPGFRNPKGVGTGEYGDGSDKDERFWAACELYASTGEEKYHNAVKAGNIYDGLGWNNMGTYGLAAYLLYASETDPEPAQKMKDKLLAAARNVMSAYRNDPYGVSLGGSYGWGSNMAVGNNAMTLLLATLFTDEGSAAEYREAAMEHIHYLLGKNALSKSYVSGFGSDPMENPHHRPSVAKKQAVPGMVSGGPNGRTGDDPALKAACTGEPPMKCYIDDKESYASNEITIYWNSPMYFVLAFLGV